MSGHPLKLLRGIFHHLFEHICGYNSGSQYSPVAIFLLTNSIHMSISVISFHFVHGFELNDDA